MVSPTAGSDPWAATVERARELDARDPLAPVRAEFAIDDDDLIYLDGNSLGRLPHATRRRVDEVVAREWGSGLIRSWHRWIELPCSVGDEVGALVGAGPGQTLVCDSTTINLYKLADAAITYQATRYPRAVPARDVLLTDDDNFPTDRYVLEGLARSRGLRLRVLRSDPVHGPRPDELAAAIDERVVLVSLSNVSYRSAAMIDMAAVNARAREVGALTLWDLAHAVGAVPVRLDEHGADLAVGCTYKYLNAGPGAPAFLYARRDLCDRLSQPIQGWFSQADQFDMGQGYRPVEGVSRFLTGTPNVLGMVAVSEGARLAASVGVEALRAKSVALTSYLIELADLWLAPLGFTVASPRDPDRRGGHVALAHPDAYRINRAYIERARVIPDFRPPDRLRLGPAPMTTRFVDVHEAMRRLREITGSGAHTEYDDTRARVT